MTSSEIMHTEISTVQQLMSTAPRGRPLDAALFSELGIEPLAAPSLVEKGWLTELQPGVYLMRGDTPSLDGTICYLATLAKGLHVAEKTALFWQGVRHNVYFREPICLWGVEPLELPSWATNLFPITYRDSTLFNNRIDYLECLRHLPDKAPCVLVSTRERAVLELVYLCKNPDLHEGVRNMLMLIRQLRLPVLQKLANNFLCRDTVLLLKELALQEGLPWASDFQA